MDRSNPYFKQVALLVKILPILNEVPDFAMKGGTAINLFYRDMPRLSVDIDLVYVPIKDLPAVKWKQHNLNQMSKDERQKMVLALEDFFGMS